MLCALSLCISRLEKTDIKKKKISFTMSLPRAPQTGCQLATTAILDPAAPEDVLE